MKINTFLMTGIVFSAFTFAITKQNDVSKNITAGVNTISTKSIPLIVNQADSTFVRASIDVNAIVTKSQQLPDEVLVEHIQLSVNEFDELENGDHFSIFIPQEQQDFNGVVDKNYQQFDGQITISTGTLDNDRSLSSFTVTKGPELTLIMLATGDKIYQIEIDNKTGIGTVIDDQALDFFRKHDDTVGTPPEGIS
jgi:hypothetical protein